jgi:hypothetical protein
MVQSVILDGPILTKEMVLAMSSKIVSEVNIDDWRQPIANYLQNPSNKVEWKFRHSAFKFALIDDVLYRQTNEGVLLKCLDGYKTQVAMGEVHEGICGTHQSTLKMK